MALSCGYKCAKYTLFVFNLLFWFAGAALLGVGIWFLVDPNALHFLKIASIDTSDSLVHGASITIVVVGAVVFLTGFLGCCGAIKESPCMLTMYAVILGLLLIMEIVAGVLAVVFRSDIQTGLEESMNKTISNYYGRPEREGETTAWDIMQKEFKCCGSKGGPSDWEGSYWRQQHTNMTVPDSCCVLNNDQPVNVTLCNAGDGGYVYKDGCSDALSQWINDHSAILIGVAFGVACLQIVAMIFACCARNTIRKGYEHV